MSGPSSREQRRFIDRMADSAAPRTDSNLVSKRPAWWWVFFMPGKVILWFEYMFPRRIGGVFGSARRRNVPLIQILYSLYFYLAMFAVVFLWFIATHPH
jgi:hypothetical protein